MKKFVRLLPSPLAALKDIRDFLCCKLRRFLGLLVVKVTFNSLFAYTNTKTVDNLPAQLSAVLRD